MGISDDAVARLSRDYPGIAIVGREREPAPRDAPWLRAWIARPFQGRRSRLARSSGPILAVRVAVDGIQGGRSQRRCRYDLIIDTSDLTKSIPMVWVLSPPDRQIKHVNIWPACREFCKWSGGYLPSFCWHKFGNEWLNAPPSWRTLGAALEYIKQLLNTENHDSPAR